ncbi:porin family protein [Chryseolinea sp. T2]|uniref:porin family protein n=1 Tax=Chryseolinea sp. T2 TaxID=3129255 RepID=UPI0030780D95
MKKTTINKLLVAGVLGSFLLLTRIDANAQFGFAIGPKGGVAITTFKGTNSENFDSRTSGFYGLFTNFQFGRVFSLQPEFLLTERGASFTSSNVRSDVRISYFDIPVLAKIRLPLANEVVFPHILLGPDFAFKTDFKATAKDTQTGSAISWTDADVKQSDVGALVGAGVDIQTRGNGIFFTIDGRYGWSFQDLNDNDNMIEVRNRGWMFAAGVGFRIGNSSGDND